jgi:hypothetical protein
MFPKIAVLILRTPRHQTNLNANVSSMPCEPFLNQYTTPSINLFTLGNNSDARRWVQKRRRVLEEEQQADPGYLCAPRRLGVVEEFYVANLASLP